MFTTCVSKGLNTIIGTEQTNLYLLVGKRLEDGDEMVVLSLRVILLSALANYTDYLNLLDNDITLYAYGYYSGHSLDIIIMIDSFRLFH